MEQRYKKEKHKKKRDHEHKKMFSAVEYILKAFKDLPTQLITEIYMRRDDFYLLSSL